MSKHKVIVSRRWPEEVERHMADVFGVQLNADDVAMSADDMRAALKSCGMSPFRKLRCGAHREHG
jgi:hypothetical protein